jgi:hypothetical protein
VRSCPVGILFLFFVEPFSTLKQMEGTFATMKQMEGLFLLQ